MGLLLWAAARAVPAALLSPFLWVILVLMARQEGRLGEARERIVGFGRGNSRLEMFRALAIGTACGLVGSCIFVGLGLSIDNTGIQFMWPLAILLMLVNRRFMCFSYAGGLLSLASLTIGWPSVRVPNVMCLVAVLHLVESLLIAADGSRGAVPVVMRNRAGRAFGGFVMQRMWPVPIVVLAAAIVPAGSAMIATPSWWPLFRLDTAAATAALSLWPMAAALGYGDLAFASTPDERARTTSITLAIYSFVLLTLAIGARTWGGFSYLAALFAICGHEGVIWLGLSRELQGPRRFENPLRGLMVLDVAPGGATQRMGLRRGDIVKRVNGRDVHGEADIEAAMPQAFLLFELEVDRGAAGVSEHVVLKRRDRGHLLYRELGVAFVPKDFGEPGEGMPQRPRGMLRRLLTPWNRDAGGA